MLKRYETELIWTLYCEPVKDNHGKMFAYSVKKRAVDRMRNLLKDAEVSERYSYFILAVPVDDIPLLLKLGRS